MSCGQATLHQVISNCQFPCLGKSLLQPASAKSRDALLPLIGNSILPSQLLTLSRLRNKLIASTLWVPNQLWPILTVNRTTVYVHLIYRSGLLYIIPNY